MSFCTDVKNELTLQKISRHTVQALLYGFMLFGRAFSDKRIALQTSNYETAEYYIRLIKTVYDVDLTMTVGGEKRPTFRVEVPSPADRLRILASVDFGMTQTPLNPELLYDEACETAFLRGVFLACGNISDPAKEYRADFPVRDSALADALAELFGKHEIAVKRSYRGKTALLYIKDSEMIEDLLTLLGASKKSLDVMDTKVLKSVKNKLNREQNFEDANLTKTVRAAVDQRVAIAYLQSRELLGSLPPELLEAALLRQQNPSATLKELSERSPSPISVSGLNHRLRRIVAIYEEIRTRQESGSIQEKGGVAAK